MGGRVLQMLLQCTRRDKVLAARGAVVVLAAVFQMVLRFVPIALGPFARVAFPVVEVLVKRHGAAHGRHGS